MWTNLNKKIKKRPIKNTWYDWIISYILEPLRKTVGSFKDKVLSFLKTNTLTIHGTGKNLSKPKIQKQSEENIIKSIWNLFKLKKENETIKDKIIRDIRTLFEEEYDYCKPTRVGNFWNNIYVEYESSGDRNKNLSIKEYLKTLNLTWGI